MKYTFSIFYKAVHSMCEHSLPYSVSISHRLGLRQVSNELVNPLIMREREECVTKVGVRKNSAKLMTYYL